MKCGHPVVIYCRHTPDTTRHSFTHYIKVTWFHKSFPAGFTSVSAFMDQNLDQMLFTIIVFFTFIFCCGSVHYTKLVTISFSICYVFH